MKSQRLIRSIVTLGVSVIIVTTRLVAQGPAQSAQLKNHPPYHLVDMGTIGGSEVTLSFAARILNNQAMFGGQCETSIADPYYPNFNPFIYAFAKTITRHACFYREGTMLDLGGAGNPENSGVSWLNSLGHAVGVAENGVIDPLTGYPEVSAVMWKDGAAIPLGSFEVRAIALSFTRPFPPLWSSVGLVIPDAEPELTVRRNIGLLEPRQASFGGPNSRASIGTHHRRSCS
jgi:hypothetical protein